MDNSMEKQIFILVFQLTTPTPFIVYFPLFFSFLSAPPPSVTFLLFSFYSLLQCISAPKPTDSQAKLRERPQLEFLSLSLFRLHWFSSWWLDAAEMMLVCPKEDWCLEWWSFSPELNKTKKWRSSATIDEFPSTSICCATGQGSTDRPYHNCLFSSYFFPFRFQGWRVHERHLKEISFARFPVFLVCVCAVSYTHLTLPTKVNV